MQSSSSDANKFNKKLKDTAAIEREKLVLEIELQDQTAPAVFSFNGVPIVPNERVEIKNLGGGKHQLVFNGLELGDNGKITCESGKLVSECELTVAQGESKPLIACPDSFEGPLQHPLVIEVPYKGECGRNTETETFSRTVELIQNRTRTPIGRIPQTEILVFWLLGRQKAIFF